MKTALLLIVLIPAFCHAETLPETDSGKKDIIGHTVLWTGMAADVFSTEYALSKPGVIETNRLGQSRTGRIGLKFASGSAVETMTYFAAKEGHPKLASWTRVILGAVNYGVAAWNVHVGLSHRPNH
jgi:hypothetical protein